MEIFKSIIILFVQFLRVDGIVRDVVKGFCEIGMSMDIVEVFY